MGYRTTVILFNDHTGEWSKDALLGEKIATAMNHTTDTKPGSRAELGYGRVVECVHADQQTLAMVHSYQFDRLAVGNWWAGQNSEAAQVELLKQAAEKLGYTLRRKAS